MQLTSLITRGTRNLKALQLSFPSQASPVVFVGQNGQGKTNLLEAIYVLAFSKSFRTNDATDLIGFNQDYFSLKGTLAKADREELMEVVMMRAPAKKVLKVNGILTRAIDFIGHLKAVTFVPDDLLLIHGPPRLRRRYLDILLLQLDHAYLSDLMNYQALLKQRNALLRLIRQEQRPEQDLAIWDERIVPLAFNIYQKRLAVLPALSEKTQHFYRSISNAQDPLLIDYIFSAGEAPGDYSAFAQLFHHSRPRDLETKNTTLGPHRDDWTVLMNGRPLQDFGSRGEWRSLVLSLKLAELALVWEKNHDPPIFLLDDVFSELDEARQQHLFKAITGVQTFVTTTHREFLSSLATPLTIFKVHAGDVSPLT